MIFYICWRLSHYWNTLFRDPISRMMLPSLVSDIFFFCPLLKTDDYFKSIRNGAIIQLAIFAVASILVYFTPLSIVALILFGGCFAIEVNKYLQKKHQATSFLADQKESIEFVSKVIDPIIKSHRLLFLYTGYLFALLFNVRQKHDITLSLFAKFIIEQML